MGRRSNFKDKQPRDYWPTVDPAAVTTLIPFIKGKTFAEPCVGNGDLVDLLFVDAKSGTTKVVLNEKDAAYVEVTDNLKFLKGNSFI